MLSNEQKQKKAVAIKYVTGEVAPKITAKGKGIVATNIINKANSDGIKVHKDEELVKELTKSDIGQYIPDGLYHAVAKILIFINELDENNKGEKEHDTNTAHRSQR